MGQVKAYLQYQGETFLGRLARMLGEAGCEPVIVVIPPSGLTCPSGVVCTVNPAPERGMLTSLQSGIRALPDSVKAVLFTPVDIPVISPATMSQMAALAGSAGIAIPTYEGHRGHPVLFDRSLFAEILALPPDVHTREIVDRHADRVRYLDVTDPGILFDVDEPSDYQRLIAEAAP